jgi:hypothetical protein
LVVVVLPFLVEEIGSLPMLYERMGSLTDEQIKRIRYLLSDEWVTDDPIHTEANLNAILADVSSTEELYHFAGNFNLDGGFDELRKVIDHPLCDKGLALLIYHRLNPCSYYSLKARGKELLPFHHEPFAFIKEIETKFRDGSFAPSVIRVDPYAFKRRTLLKPTTRGIEHLPDIMKVPSEGEEVDLIDLW